MKAFRFILVFLILAFPVLTASAASTPKSTSFNEQILYNTPGGENEYPWWAIMDHNGQNYGKPCDPSGTVCITRMTEGSEHFARLSVGHDIDQVGYNNADFAELQTGYSADQGIWLPTIGHEVVFTQTLRFDSNYNQDGTGGAVGSAGGGFWNSYPDANCAFQCHPIKAFWWSWGETGQFAGYASGLTINIFNQDVSPFPLVLLPVTVPLNMQDWMTWTITWSALPDGNQSVKFEVAQNGVTHDLGTYEVPPYQALSSEDWNDNQFINANFEQEFHNPPVGQVDNWDLAAIDTTQH